MKRLIRVWGVSLMSLFLAVAIGCKPGGAARTWRNPYLCPMHPEIVRESGGQCPRCGMNLEVLHNHQPKTPLPPVQGIYISPDNYHYLHEGPGSDPKTGRPLIPVTESPIYEPPGGASSPDATHNGEAHKSGAKVPVTQLWTCGMHPEVIQDHPGNCPLCGMKLVPKRTASAPSEGGVVIQPAVLQSIGITTATATAADLTVELRTNGVIKVPEDRVYSVNSKAMGWVEKLFVSRPGESVRRGQPVAEIYSPDLLAVQEEYLLALKTRSPNVPGEVRQDLVESARMRLRLWDMSDAQIAELESSGTSRRTVTLFSPVSGVVVDKMVVEGSAVMPGMELLRIADLSTVWVEAQVFPTETAWLEPGIKGIVILPDQPSVRLDARVELILPVADEMTRTTRVLLRLENSEMRLRPETYVTVVFSALPRRTPVAVPKNAVLRSGRRDLVFVDAGGGRYIPREVQLGLETEELYEVRSGLEPGEAVVLNGLFLLDSEAKLQEAVMRRQATHVH